MLGLTSFVSKTLTTLKEKAQEITTLDDSNKQPANSEVLAPWERVPETWQGREVEFRHTVKNLSLDVNTFHTDAPADFTFSFDNPKTSVDVAMKVVESDPQVAAARFKLVPRVLSEDEFWRNYFYRVHVVESTPDFIELQQQLKQINVPTKRPTKRFPLKQQTQQQQQEQGVELPELPTAVGDTALDTESGGAAGIAMDYDSVTGELRIMRENIALFREVFDSLRAKNAPPTTTSDDSDDYELQSTRMLLVELLRTCIDQKKRIGELMSQLPSSTPIASTHSSEGVLEQRQLLIRDAVDINSHLGKILQEYQQYERSFDAAAGPSSSNQQQTAAETSTATTGAELHSHQIHTHTGGDAAVEEFVSDNFDDEQIEQDQAWREKMRAELGLQNADVEDTA